MDIHIYHMYQPYKPVFVRIFGHKVQAQICMYTALFVRDRDLVASIDCSQAFVAPLQEALRKSGIPVGLEE